MQRICLPLANRNVNDLYSLLNLLAHLWAELTQMRKREREREMKIRFHRKNSEHTNLNHYISFLNIWMQSSPTLSWWVPIKADWSNITNMNVFGKIPFLPCHYKLCGGRYLVDEFVICVWNPMKIKLMDFAISESESRGGPAVCLASRGSWVLPIILRRVFGISLEIFV